MLIKVALVKLRAVVTQKQVDLWQPSVGMLVLVVTSVISRLYLAEARFEVYAKLPPGLRPDRGIGHTITTGMSWYVCKPMYRLSPKEKS